MLGLALLLLRVVVLLWVPLPVLMVVLALVRLLVLPRCSTSGLLTRWTPRQRCEA